MDTFNAPPPPSHCRWWWVSFKVDYVSNQCSRSCSINCNWSTPTAHHHPSHHTLIPQLSHASFSHTMTVEHHPPFKEPPVQLSSRHVSRGPDLHRRQLLSDMFTTLSILIIISHSIHKCISIPHHAQPTSGMEQLKRQWEEIRTRYVSAPLSISWLPNPNSQTW